MPENATNLIPCPPLKICILGGTGFVGQHIISCLAGFQHKITVLSRHPERKRDLGIYPGVRLIRADCHNPKTLADYFAGQDAVINLVGILNERGDTGKEFHHVHVDLAEKVTHACKKQAVRRLLHMGALNADSGFGRSHYLLTKGEAEEIVHAAATDRFQVTSFQPSVIFGPEDGFFNRFAKILRLTPYFVPIACPRTKFAPVYVDDVAQAFVASLHNPLTAGKRLALCGPTQYTLKQLVEFTAHTLKLRRRVIGLGRVFSKLQARLLEFLPGKPMSRDNYRSLQIDSCCEHNALYSLGIEPRSIEAIVPTYLSGAGERGRLNDLRKQSRRH